MKRFHARKGGFTLIELMIVVAIIGILAAIAIPNFLRFQLKAKSSEGKTNLAAIRTAEQSYYSEFGNYVSAAAEPAVGTLTSSKQSFSTNAGFNTLGWSPEGRVYFSYGVGSDDGTGFLATAMADIDADGTDQEWAYNKPLGGGGNSATAATHTCAAIGSYNTDQVGPCESPPTSGQSVF